MNALTDMDWAWWPFLFLKPVREEHIDNRRLSKMTLYFGPFQGGIIGLLLILGIHKATGIWVAWPILFGIVLQTAVFFVVYRYTFAVFWNRRAERLRISRESAAAVGIGAPAAPSAKP